MCETCACLLDAADEIERLRAEVDSQDALAYRAIEKMYHDRGLEIERLRAEVDRLGMTHPGSMQTCSRCLTAHYGDGNWEEVARTVATALQSPYGMEDMYD